jgi:hypothetical protein
MRRFKVEDKTFEKPDMYITLHNPPYEDVDVLSKVSKKWKLKDTIITDVTPTFEGDE